jgi:hypothetical protein
MTAFESVVKISILVFQLEDLRLHLALNVGSCDLVFLALSDSANEHFEQGILSELMKTRFVARD